MRFETNQKCYNKSVFSVRNDKDVEKVEDGNTLKCCYL